MKTMDIQKTRMAWDRISEGYDQFITSARDANLAARLLKRAGLKKGMHFLDVAAGTGALALPAARMGGRVTAVDLAPNMIRLLKARAAREGLENVEGYAMDGHALDLPDNHFDVTGSQFGVMLFPDLPKGLKEMVRVTKPGGAVLVITFSTPDRVDFIHFFFTALQAVDPDFQGLPQGPPPLPFQVSDPKVLRHRMEASGLYDVQVTRETEHFEYKSGTGLWNSVLSSNPIATQVTAGLTEKQKRQARQLLDERVKARAGRDGIAVLQAELNVGVGRVSR